MRRKETRMALHIWVAPSIDHERMAAAEVRKHIRYSYVPHMVPHAAMAQIIGRCHGGCGRIVLGDYTVCGFCQMAMAEDGDE
jgi:hypothetical protein